MAKFCFDCGTAIETGEKFCSGCGKALAVTPPPAPVCPKCGAAVEAGERFCAACGAKTDADTPEQTAAPEQPAPEQQQIQSVKQEIHEQAKAQTHVQPPPFTANLPTVKTQPPGAVKYWIWLFVMTLPLAGFVVSILWSKNKEPSDRRSLARAMIFYSVVWLVVCIAFAVTLSLFLQAKDLVNIDFKLFGIKLF